MVEMTSIRYLALATCIASGLIQVTEAQAGGGDYGADVANTSFVSGQADAKSGEQFDYLALRDHTGPSGVPLGGIGTGCFDLAPDGRFTRIGLNNTHLVIPGDAGRGCFFSLWERSGGAAKTVRLVRDSDTRFGAPGYEHSTYTGLFPRAIVSFDNGPESMENVTAKIHAYSGLVPHNVKDSSLPVAWFDVELHAKESADVALAFSWEDFIGRGLREPATMEGIDGQILEGDRIWLVWGDKWVDAPRVPTGAKPYASGAWKGVLQYAKTPIALKKATFQNLVNQVAILADAGSDSTVSVLPAYSLDGGDAAWKPFADGGSFGSAAGDSALSDPSGGSAGSVVSVRTRLRAGEKKTVRFMVAWHYPEMKIDRGSAAPGSYWSTCDYGRWFHNYFPDIDSLVRYAGKERGRILRETMEWQTPVLESSMPDWLKFKLINSAYTMYTNTILNKDGGFTVMEGGMGGLAGTMDQRISAHPFYQKFFTELDRSEMQLFADCQDPDGFILHFIGHYYVGIAPKGGPAPTEKGWMLDNAGGWIIQLAKDYSQTGDIEYLRRNADHVKKALAFLKSKMPEGVQIPVGPTTYDDYSHPPIYSYGAGMYLATLKAAAEIGRALGDDGMARECEIQFVKSRSAMIRMLWNGRFFSYGCGIDGSKRLDNVLFTGQLGGQFMSRYCGWGDAIPLDMVRASIISQFKTSLSHTPDYYANKVWDVAQAKGIDMPGSQCWPFYLESYTAMPAIQAGYLDDGLDIMKHIQLVHLRKGYTWSQCLWNPGELTYMTAPVTWFMTDVLAGSNLDAPSGTLYLAPVGPIEGAKTLETPIFFPDFWATLSYDPSARKASLKVIKVFGERRLTIRKLVSEPIGVPTSDRKLTPIPEFVVEKGAVLDLSPYWDRISGAVRRPAVLPVADKVEFMEVNGE